MSLLKLICCFSFRISQDVCFRPIILVFEEFVEPAVQSSTSPFLHIIILYYQFTIILLHIFMKLTSLLPIILLLSFFHLNTSKMILNLDQSSIKVSFLSVKVRLALQGGQSPYIYHYSSIPSQWKQMNELLYIPIHYLQTNEIYICTLKVRDRTGEQVAISFSLHITGKRLFVVDVNYTYDDSEQQDKPTKNSDSTKENAVLKTSKQEIGSSSENREKNNAANSQVSDFNSINRNSQISEFSPQFPFIRENAGYSPSAEIQLVPISEQFHLNERQIQEKIQNAEKSSNQNTYKNRENSHSGLDRSMDEIFKELPTFQQLDDVILKADILAISMTIQSVIESSMTCEQKIAYLSEFSGRIQNQVQVQKLSLQKLILGKELAEKQIQRLLQEVERLNKEQQELNLFGLYNQLRSDVSELEASYDKFNEATRLRDKAQQMFDKKEKKQAELKNEKNSKIKDIEESRSQLSDLDAEIFNIERRYREEMEAATKKRRNIKEHIAKSIQKVAQLEKQIQKNEEEKKVLVKFLKEAPKKLDQLKKTSLGLQIQVERMRKEIEEKTQKQNKIISDIAEMEVSIQEQEMRIDEILIRQKQNMVDNLERNLPHIQQEIDALYYSCYNTPEIVEKPIKTEKQQSVGYKVEPNQYQNYIVEAFGKNQTKNMQKIKEQKKQINLTKSTVFSNVWSENYGTPYNEIEEVKEEPKKTPLVKDDFHCLKPSDSVTQSGIIKFIRNNLIVVLGDDGIIYRLYMGSCTRIESLGSRIPIVGQRINFKGNKKESSSMDVYSASSY